jgi:hypothetical protein
MRMPAVVRSWIDPLTERIPLPVVAGANRGRWCALASYTGTARFGGGDTSKMHALGSGDEEVSVCTGEMVHSAVVRQPTFVKIDVEGAEADVLAGALPIVPSRAVILMAIHSGSADQACTRLLRANGFELIPSGALDRARRLGWRGDPDLLCIGPDYEDGGRIERLLQSGCFQRA